MPPLLHSSEGSGDEQAHEEDYDVPEGDAAAAAAAEEEEQQQEEEEDEEHDNAPEVRWLAGTPRVLCSCTTTDGAIGEEGCVCDRSVRLTRARLVCRGSAATNRESST